jgi:hypothetical protein
MKTMTAVRRYSHGGPVLRADEQLMDPASRVSRVGRDRRECRESHRTSQRTEECPRYLGPGGRDIHDRR